MARMNEILTGRHNRFLQKHFSMKGEPPAPQLSSEIMPVIPFRNGNENRYIESWARYGLFTSAGSVAAQFSAFRLRNPSNNIVVVLERLCLGDSVANSIELRIGLTTVDLLSATFQGVRLDARQAISTQGNSTAILSVATNAPTPPSTLIQFGRVQLQANLERELILFEDQEYTLLPGDAMDFRELNTPGAELLTIQLLWRERQIEESERF